MPYNAGHEHMDPNTASFYQHYRQVRCHSAHFDFSAGGNHDWSTWGPQLGAMAGGIVAVIK